MIIFVGLPVPPCSPPSQVPLLWHCGEGEFPVLRCHVLQEGGSVGERDGQEGGDQADRGVFTPLQAGNAPARVPKCQRSKSARQSARGEGKQDSKSPPPLPPRPSFHPTSSSPPPGLPLLSGTLSIYTLAPH